MSDFPMDTEKLEAAVRFTMQDGQRLLCQDDVSGICPHGDMCFEYTDRVRCGPCASKQSMAHGVEPDWSLPFSPEEYRLRRRLKAAQEGVEGLRATVSELLDMFDNEGMTAEQFFALVKEKADGYREVISGPLPGEVDPMALRE